jgi:hypothetical protein
MHLSVTLRGDNSDSFQLWFPYEGRAWPVGGQQSLDDCRELARKMGYDMLIGKPDLPWAY